MPLIAISQYASPGTASSQLGVSGSSVAASVAENAPIAACSAQRHTPDRVTAISAASSESSFLKRSAYR